MTRMKQLIDSLNASLAEKTVIEAMISEAYPRIYDKYDIMSGDWQTTFDLLFMEFKDHDNDAS